MIVYIPLLTALYFTYIESQESVKKMILKNNENIAKGIKGEIQTFFSDTNKLLISLSENPIIKSRDTKKIDNLLSKVYKNDSFYLNILVADMNGNNIGSAINYEKAHRLNYADMDWFKNSIKGEPTINNPHVSKLFKEMTFMMTYPVFKDNKQIAVIGIPLNLDKINKSIVKEYSLKEKSNVIVVNEKGIVMTNLLFPDFIGKPVQKKELFDAIFSIKSGTFTQLGIDNVERIYSIETIDKYKWKIIVGTPTKEIFAESINSIKKILITSILIIFISFIFAINIANGLNKKVDNLITGIEEFGKGMLNFRFDTKGIKDEFEKIFNTFNFMAENIERSNEEIKRLNKVYRLLSEINQKIVKYTDIQRLLNDITKDIIEIGEYKLCYIFQIDNNNIIPLSFYGTDEETLKIVLSEKKELCHHETINKSVINKKNFISNSQHNKEYNFDYAAFISIPLIVENNIFGVMLVFKQDQNFNYQETNLLEELTSDIAFAINNINIVNEKRRMEELISGIFEGMGEGLALIDRDLKIIMTNKKYMEIIDKKPNEILNKNCYKVIYDFDSPCFFKQQHCVVKEIFEDGKEKTKIIELKNKRGETRIISLKFFPFFREQSIQYVIEIANDITELKKLEAQYLHAQKLESIGRFTAGIAHDFNNILTGILGFATLAQTEKNEKNLQKNLSNIIDLTDKASNLTRSLLTFSRKTTPIPENLDLNKLISEMIKILNRMVGEDVVIEAKLHESPLFVFADPVQLEQVLMNLATNAKDAMPQGGKIIIELNQTEIDERFINFHNYGKIGEYALLSFTDTGCGIPEELLNKIFEPFFTTKEVGKGTGLGLSVVYGIIKNHDGFINVYSEVGKGTTFKIYLPLNQKNIETTKQDKGVILTQNLHIKALLIDDNDSVREVTRKILENYGIEVISTDNIETALKILKNQKFDIIISDVIMPIRNGVDLYLEVRKSNIKTPFLFISGYPVDLISEKYGIEIENILIKPITPLSLLTKIKNVLNI